MPREDVELRYQRVSCLSIRDEDGGFDEALAPEASDDLLLRIHRTMRLARRLDERMLKLQRQGRIGTFAPVSGARSLRRSGASSRRGGFRTRNVSSLLGCRHGRCDRDGPLTKKPFPGTKR